MSKTDSNNGFDQLLQKISRKSGQSKPNVRKFVLTLFEEIGTSLENEERVALDKIGVFKKKYVSERKVYNPQKKKKITSPGHYRTSFSPAKKLSGEVNKKYRHLKPNVLDEIKNITSIRKPARDDKQRTSPLTKKARRRAKITLLILLLSFIAFISAVILIPATFKKTDVRAIQYIHEINQIMGLKNLSDSLSKNIPEIINVKRLGQFIWHKRRELSRNRKIVNVHRVKSGDTIYSIAKNYWGNQYLWPDLYYLNKERFEDPGLLRPGDSINIYKSLGDPQTLDTSQRRILVEAYITMYRVSRALGENDISAGKTKKGEERIRESRWTLYTAARYEHDLLKLFEDAIYPEDATIVDDYINRFGYGDGTERYFWEKIF